MTRVLGVVDRPVLIAFGFIVVAVLVIGIYVLWDNLRELRKK